MSFTIWSRQSVGSDEMKLCSPGDGVDAGAGVAAGAAGAPLMTVGVTGAAGVAVGAGVAAGAAGAGAGVAAGAGLAVGATGSAIGFHLVFFDGRVNQLEYLITYERTTR